VVHWVEDRQISLSGHDEQRWQGLVPGHQRQYNEDTVPGGEVATYEPFDVGASVFWIEGPGSADAALGCPVSQALDQRFFLLNRLIFLPTHVALGLAEPLEQQLQADGQVDQHEPQVACTCGDGDPHVENQCAIGP
jgi:hypothetical protein